MNTDSSSENVKKIAIVDYKMGNIRSVLNALRFIGCHAIVTDSQAEVESADAIVLPGVGAFGEAMKNLTKQRLIDCLNEQVIERKKPFLGICLGMQLLAEKSFEHGEHVGLGWIPGEVRRLHPESGYRVPHVGWNDIRILRREPLFESVEESPNFYFVHSYHFECDESFVAAQCHYGMQIVSAIQRQNIFATQFHPEKSQYSGLKVLKNFVSLANRLGW